MDTPNASSDRITRQLYDAAGRLQYKVDAESYVTRYQYDGAGNLTESVLFEDKYGAQPLSYFFLDAPSLRADAANHNRVNSFAYDAAGQLVRSTDALGQAESFSYNGVGSKFTFTNKQAATWTYYYDAAGRLTQETSPVVELSTLSATPAGVAAAVSPTVTTTSVGIVTRISYDALGQVSSRTEASGRAEERTTRYEYDSVGHQIKTSYPKVGVYNAGGDDLASNGAASLAQRKDIVQTLFNQTAYNVFGEAIVNLDVAGNLSYKTYDKAGRVLCDVDALGQLTRFDRDVFGQAIGLTRYNQATSLARNIGPATVGQDLDSRRATIRANYFDSASSAADKAAAVLASSITVEELAQATDKSVAEVRAYFAGNGIARASYDKWYTLVQAAPAASSAAIGAVVGSTDLANRLLQTSYDRMGRVSKVTEPRVATYDSGYSRSDKNKVVITLQEASKVTDNSYNAFGEVQSVTLSGVLTSSHFYTLLGQLQKTVDAEGYVTTQQYDAAGNLTSRTEFAKAVASAALEPQASADEDRTTVYGYDALNRKVRETRFNVQYADSSSNSALADIATHKRDKLITSYDYDALGNLVCTTAANGAQTFSYYDVLGRVKAVVEPMRVLTSTGAGNGVDTRTAAPLTEFKRDAYGNVLLKIERAKGASAASVSGYTAGPVTGDDRASYSYFDAMGHAVQQIDAAGYQHFSAYDTQGHLAKSWQTVQDGTDANAVQTSTLFKVYCYDALGQLLQTKEPAPTTLESAALTITSSTLRYNAFGELVAKQVDGAAAEYYDYDTAGRLWRSNSGDGVDKIYLYDAQGRTSAELRSNGATDLRTAYSTVMAAAMNASQLRVTEMVYDKLGRLVETLGPARTTQPRQNITTRDNVVYATVMASSQGPAGVGYNQVDLTWRSLEDLGSGDVQISVSYMSVEFTTTSGTDNVITHPAALLTRTVLVSAEEARNGYILKFTDPFSPSSDGPGGITAIRGITIQKKDLYGKWVVLYDVGIPEGSGVNVPAGWADRPNVGYFWANPGEGRIPVYRLYNRYSGHHFTTSSPTSRDICLNHMTGWTDEGIVGYVSTTSGEELIPAVHRTALYRLNKNGTDLHIYTIDWNEVQTKLGQGWVRDGELSDASGGKIDGWVNPGPGGDGIALSSMGHGEDVIYGVSQVERDMLKPANSTVYGTGGSYYTNGSPGKIGLSVEVGFPNELMGSLSLRYCKVVAGTDQPNGAWSTMTNAPAFGSASRFDIGALGLSAGGYCYEVLQSGIGEQPSDAKVLGSGTFTIPTVGVADHETLPPIEGVSQNTALIDGNVHQVLQWNQPAMPSWVMFSYRAAGSSGAWTTWNLDNGMIYGPAHTNLPGKQCLALDNLPAGTWEYELRIISQVNGESTHRTGTAIIAATPLPTIVTPAITLNQNGVQNLGIEGYLWDSPGAYRKAVHRYYLQNPIGHHLLTADQPTIDWATAEIQRNGSTYVLDEGIVGYVDAGPSANNRRLYLFKWGTENVYRVSTNPDEVGPYLISNSPSDTLLAGRWYRCDYKNDGYLPSQPLAGTKALYRVLNNNAYGNCTKGDYLNSTLPIEVGYLLGSSNIATAAVSGVNVGKAWIDGSGFTVLQWPAPEAGSRTTVTCSPPMPDYGAMPPVFGQASGHGTWFSGGNGQGVVLNSMAPGSTYTLSIQIEHPAANGHAAYVARTDVTLQSPVAVKEPQCIVLSTCPRHLCPAPTGTFFARLSGDAGKAWIDGSGFTVLQWPAPEAGM